MLTATILIPLLGALALVFVRLNESAYRGVACGVASVPLLLLIGVWLGFDTGDDTPAFQYVVDYPWIPALGIGWRMGVDGIALAIAAMSALLFVAAIAWPAETRGRAREYYAWFLFLEAVSLGVFLTLDLALFYVFFDLSLVGLFFLIGRWGHGDAERAALKFFVYTFAGSLAILLAIIGLVLATEPLTFDMRTLIAEQALADTDVRATLVFVGFLVGFGIKTPFVPLHTWLPPAHVNAPGPASAVLAGVLLKMGTYGLIRIPYSMLSATFARYAFALAVLAVISILWGALVSMAQRDFKRRIAYTSVNHMGYVLLGIAAAAAIGGEHAAQQMALTGATVEMVAHGLITGALFLICGAFWQRTHDYNLEHYGGLAGVAPNLTRFTVLASFASLGLPGLAGFVAELQIFVGAFSVYPWLAAIALLGILITAALFLQMLQQLFFGELPPEREGFTDLLRIEIGILAVLALLIVLIGVYPNWLLTPINSATAVLTGGR